jgi:hypothetical protein
MDPVPAGHSAHIHVLVSSRSRGHSSWTQAMSSSTTKSVCSAHRHSAYATPARRHGLPVLMEQTLCPHEVQHAVVAVDLPRHGAVDRHSLVGEVNLSLFHKCVFFDDDDERSSSKKTHL